MIAEAADHYCLRTLPEIMMVEGRMSPMIWCGLKPKLILPIKLWSQLDDVGRRAVVFLFTD